MVSATRVRPNPGEWPLAEPEGVGGAWCGCVCLWVNLSLGWDSRMGLGWEFGALGAHVGAGSGVRGVHEGGRGL